jgi:polynucleotide 5'-kinase involved in rRNA processing
MTTPVKYSNNKKFPILFQVFTFLNGTPVFFSRNERMLNAGWQSKDVVSELYFGRWAKKRIDTYLSGMFNNSNLINIMALLPGGNDKLGDIVASENSKIYLSKKDYEDIEEDVKKVIESCEGKTGCLLYGKPGMGKTRLVKYISSKYMLPIYSIYLNPDYNNLDILTMFGSIP